MPLILLMLIARPISRLWPQPLRYRRAGGEPLYWLWLILVICSTIHLHGTSRLLISCCSSNWLWQVALVDDPGCAYQFDRFQSYLGKRWRQIHLLGVPALLLSGIHTVLIGSHYLGELEWTGESTSSLNRRRYDLVLLARARLFWSLLLLEVLRSTSNT